jgi:hypothetical protein
VLLLALYNVFCHLFLDILDKLFLDLPLNGLGGLLENGKINLLLLQVL